MTLVNARVRARRYGWVSNTRCRVTSNGNVVEFGKTIIEKRSLYVSSSPGHRNVIVRVRPHQKRIETWRGVDRIIVSTTRTPFYSFYAFRFLFVRRPFRRLPADVQRPFRTMTFFLASSRFIVYYWNARGVPVPFNANDNRPIELRWSRPRHRFLNRRSLECLGETHMFPKVQNDI